MSSSLFRLIGGLCQSMILANTGGSFVLLIIFMLGGFIIPRGKAQLNDSYIFLHKFSGSLRFYLLQRAFQNGGFGGTIYHPLHMASQQSLLMNSVPKDGYGPEDSFEYMFI